MNFMGWMNDIPAKRASGIAEVSIPVEQFASIAVAFNKAKLAKKPLVFIKFNRDTMVFEGIS